MKVKKVIVYLILPNFRDLKVTGTIRDFINDEGISGDRYLKILKKFREADGCWFCLGETYYIRQVFINSNWEYFYLIKELWRLE